MPDRAPHQMPDEACVVLLGQAAQPVPERIANRPRLKLHEVDARALPDVIGAAHALLCWEPDAKAVCEALPRAERLRWIQWPFTGVDSLVGCLKSRSEIQLTNAGGVFDGAIAEYVLALILAMAKGLPETWAAQTRRDWRFRETETIAGRKALIVGIGGVGRAVGAMLKAAGMEVTGVGRSRRQGEGPFIAIHAADDLLHLVPDFDYVISAAPLTPQTNGIFSRGVLYSMNRSARFINIGRGELVDEEALADALDAGAIAGAAIDVFREEPLPQDSRLWSMEQCIVSPHMAGDVKETNDRIAVLFWANLEKFLDGEPLENQVDLELGFRV